LLLERTHGRSNIVEVSDLQLVAQQACPAQRQPVLVALPNISSSIGVDAITPP
jgi:hypothetical protein